MRSSFVSLLLAGWLVNPIAIAIAHLLHADTNPALVHVLLATSFNAPFGLMLNEVLAANQAKYGSRSALRYCYLTLLVQCACSAFLISRFILDERSLTVAGLMLALTISVSSLYSYKAVVVLYRLIAAKSISRNDLLLAGSVPGIVTIAIYGLYFLLYLVQHEYADITLFGICLLPSIAQYLVIRIKHSSGLLPVQEHGLRITARAFAGMFVGFALLSLAGLLARKAISGNAGEYAAICLVFVNGALSLVSSVAKADYFMGREQQLSGRMTAFLAFLVAVSSIHLYLVKNNATAIVCLVVVQYVLIRLMIVARQKLFVHADDAGDARSPSMVQVSVPGNRAFHEAGASQ